MIYIEFLPFFVFLYSFYIGHNDRLELPIGHIVWETAAFLKNFFFQKNANKQQQQKVKLWQCVAVSEMRKYWGNQIESEVIGVLSDYRHSLWPRISSWISSKSNIHPFPTLLKIRTVNPKHIGGGGQIEPCDAKIK